MAEGLYCMGGPMDGQWYAVPEGQWYFDIAEPPKLNLFDFVVSSIMTLERPKLTRYVRRVFGLMVRPYHVNVLEYPLHKDVVQQSIFMPEGDDPIAVANQINAAISMFRELRWIW